MRLGENASTKTVLVSFLCKLFLFPKNESFSTRVFYFHHKDFLLAKLLDYTTQCAPLTWWNVQSVRLLHASRPHPKIFKPHIILKGLKKLII